MRWLGATQLDKLGSMCRKKWKIKSHDDDDCCPRQKEELWGVIKMSYCCNCKSFLWLMPRCTQEDNGVEWLLLGNEDQPSHGQCWWNPHRGGTKELFPWFSPRDILLEAEAYGGGEDLKQRDLQVPDAAGKGVWNGGLGLRPWGRLREKPCFWRLAF